MYDSGFSRNTPDLLSVRSAEYINTSMTAELDFLLPEAMIQPDDVAEAAMLAVRTRASCVPPEITLRNGPGTEKSSKS